MQTISYFDKRKETVFSVPSENSTVCNNIKWGKIEHFFTPAFWYAQTLIHEFKETPLLDYKLGDTFNEEVIACLIGGYGIPSEIGNAKFYQLRPHINKLLLNPNLAEIEAIMMKEMNLSGKAIKYRFAKQKAKYIYSALIQLKQMNERELTDLELRNQLLKINGIGPKTASWIVRNYRKSDEVAIIDIHIHRAGLLAGFFSVNDDLNKDYFKMEKKFLEFCQGLKVSSAKLDAIIWRIMKNLNNVVLEQLKNRNLIAA